MTSKADERALLPHLQRALGEPFGLELTFIDADSARFVRQKLYALRKEHTEYAPLSFLVKDDCIWLIKATPNE